MSNYEMIKQAIQNKQSFTCDYNGYIRHMSPHVLGRKGGDEQVLCYQYDGESSGGLSTDPTENWRCITISKVSNLKVNGDKFETADNHSRPQTCVGVIDVEVAW